MNSRTVHKRLYHARHRNFWGKRSYVTIELPRDIFSSHVQPPSIPDGLVSSGFRGMFFRRGEDGGNTEMIDIARSSCAKMPDRETYEHYDSIISNSFSVDEVGYHVWWSSKRGVKREDGSWVWSAFLQPWVSDLVKFYDWVDSVPEDVSHPVLEKLQRAQWYAKSTDVNVDSFGNVFFMFGVKYFKHSTLDRFSAALSRTVKLAKKMNVPVRVTF